LLNTGKFQKIFSGEQSVKISVSYNSFRYFLRKLFAVTETNRSLVSDVTEAASARKLHRARSTSVPYPCCSNSLPIKTSHRFPSHTKGRSSDEHQPSAARSTLLNKADAASEQCNMSACICHAETRCSSRSGSKNKKHGNATKLQSLSKFDAHSKEYENELAEYGNELT
jgi:hypothetical protein